MYLIVGLGNPEEDYSKTRHNMGFEVINKISKQYNILVNKSKFNSLYGTGVIEGEKVILVKPQTFMNLSWESVLKLMSFYKIQKEDIIVIFDDISLEPGKIRFREKWSAWWQNGVKNIISHIWEDFKRIKIGIWYNQKWDLTDWVLWKFSDEEKDFLYKNTFPEVHTHLWKHFN